MRLFKWLSLVLFFAGLAGVAGASLIYSDDFSGSPSTNLAGTTPDVTVDGNVWQSMTIGDSWWMADGSIAAPSVSQNRNALLAFTPESGKVYTLSLTMNPQGSDYFALGFTGTASLNGSFTSSTAPAAAPWMFIQYDHTLLSRTYYGPGTAGNVAINPPAEGWGTDVDLSISLDTTEAAWAVEWFINGNSVRTYTYASNPTINYVGFGRQGLASGYVDNFELSVVPEPMTIGLLGGGGLALLVFRRRL